MPNNVSTLRCTPRMLDRARKFYESTLGWKFTPWDRQTSTSSDGNR